ncbi:MAG TPA: hypothetical protein VIN11_01315, partial [Roseivirga sp.]
MLVNFCRKKDSFHSTGKGIALNFLSFRLFLPPYTKWSLYFLLIVIFTLNPRFESKAALADPISKVNPILFDTTFSNESVTELDFLKSLRFSVKSDYSPVNVPLATIVFEEFSTDTDQDGVIDINDIDDDNDGILDTIEGCTDTVVAGANGSSITEVAATTRNLSNAIDGVNGTVAELRTNGAMVQVVLRSGNTVQLGTTINIRAQRTGNLIESTITVTESTNGSSFVNPKVLSFASRNVFENKQYTLTTNATHIRISYQQAQGNIEIDNISFNQYIIPCVGQDTDLDGIPDQLDIDSDGDGIVDIIEAQATTGTPIVPTGVDTDGDGLDNAFDLDNGGTALPLVDTDSDGDPDYLDFNSDGDGFTDRLEGWDVDGDQIIDTNPSGSDSDGDGLDNAYDIVSGPNSTTNVYNNQDALDFPNVTTIGNTSERDWREVNVLDSDLDGRPNVDDLDDDNDGILDTVEGENTDTDGDGIMNSLDLDSDDDGIPDIIEAGGIDIDFDGRVDDNADGDIDGWANTFDSDNGGTALPNPDTDTDGIKDMFDLDSDNDGIHDILEAGGVDANLNGRVDTSSDLDQDGWKDIFDSTNGGTALSMTDTDGDGIRNYLDI